MFKIRDCTKGTTNFIPEINSYKIPNYLRFTTICIYRRRKKQHEKPIEGI